MTKSIGKAFLILTFRTHAKNDEILKSVSERLDGQELDLAIYVSEIYKVPETALVQRLKTAPAFLRRLSR
jgi:hypothetical protein